MAYQRPNLQDLIKRIYTDLTSKSGVKKSILEKTFLKAIAAAIAGVAHLLYGYLDYIFKEAFPTTCSEATLHVWAYIYGVPRKQASFAIRKVKFSGANGATILQTTVIKNADGIEYETLNEVQIVNGIAQVLVRCLSAGSIGNIAADEVLSLISPIAGIQSSIVVLAEDAINGQDQEEIEYWRERILLKIRQPPHGGNEADYKSWALSIPGVTRVWVYPHYLGIGTVGLAFINDAEEDIFPTPAKVAEVQNIIDELRPVTAELFVFAPIKNEIDFHIQISPNTLQVREAISSALKDLIRREGGPGGTILISHVREAISLSVGEFDHVLVSPAANIISPVGHLPVLGNITFEVVP